jgi:putative hemolysin
MSTIVTEVLFIFLLVMANGVLSMSEFAIISARKERLQRRAEAGHRGARGAMYLLGELDRFLSTIQVGITLVGILAGAIGGATAAHSLAAWIATFPALQPFARTIALALVALVITYFTLILGELVPKRVALSNPERIAILVARPMRVLAKIVNPAVWLLSKSTDLTLRVLGVTGDDRPAITEDEIRAMLQQGTDAGVIEEVEQDMVESVFLLNDRPASALMTPRHEVMWLDLEDSPEELKAQIVDAPFSRFPVGRESLDVVLGEVKAKDLLVRAWAGEPFDLEQIMQRPLYVPEIMPALKVLEEFRASGTQMALVIDEYGSVEGLVTLTDILEAIVGDIPAPDQPEEPQAIQREDGTWLADGMLTTDEFRRAFDLRELPGEDQGLYQTLAGFVVMHLGRVPSVTDSFEWHGMRFEVMDMDGPRVDKVLVTFLPDERGPWVEEEGAPADDEEYWGK